ncbi:unnamed protein product [Prorocentrum cordatum]|uniref:Uncharacterized protein n=1 Tax=Prorocentrum cordatum TaxID=2364126 RepID=A0ABN9QLL1_9DINO|nr:unnamed protein product [Polarella glacialis]
MSSTGRRRVLSGFQRADLNRAYYFDVKIQVGGRGTYWDSERLFFMYYQKLEHRWAISLQAQALFLGLTLLLSLRGGTTAWCLTSLMNFGVPTLDRSWPDTRSVSAADTASSCSQHDGHATPIAHWLCHVVFTLNQFGNCELPHLLFNRFVLGANFDVDFVTVSTDPLPG